MKRSEVISQHLTDAAIAVRNAATEHQRARGIVETGQYMKGAAKTDVEQRDAEKMLADGGKASREADGNARDAWTKFSAVRDLVADLFDADGSSDNL